MTKPLKELAVGGIKWSGGSMSVTTLLQFATLVVLANILSPSDFGLMGLMIVVIEFARLFADMGVSNAIIHRQDVTRNELSSLYWLNVLVGIVLCLVVCSMVPLITTFYDEQRLVNLIYLLSLSFLITPFGQQFQVLLQKELKFDQLAIIDIASHLANSLTAITLAILGAGVLSLVWGLLASAFLRVLMLFYYGWKRWKPSMHFSTHDLKNYISFGLFQTGEKSINYLSANIDYIIIGRLLGSEALGFYTLAYQLSIFPLSKINPIVARVAFPVFAKIQNDNEKMKRGFCKAVKYISMITFPLLIGLSTVAQEFINVVFGSKWEPAIAALQILCLVGIFKSIGSLGGTVLLAKGRADIGFYVNVAAVVMVSLAVIVGVNWGINGVAYAILVLQVPFFIIIQPFINREIDLKYNEFFKAIRLPVVCSVLMFFAISTLRATMDDLGEISTLISMVLAGIVIYTSCLYLADRTVFTELRSMIKRN